MERQIINLINKQIIYVVLEKVLSSYGKRKREIGRKRCK